MIICLFDLRITDDWVLYRTIKTQEDTAILQKDLDQLALWERTWQMEFHPQKCHIMGITRAKRSRISGARPWRGELSHIPWCHFSL